jgi:membrane protein DedA with SNARE-associated domain
MINELTRWIMHTMQQHGPATVFIGVIIESIIVPIPSPLIIMGAGVVLIPPGLGLGGAFVPIMTKIVLPGALASTLGAFFCFGIAFWGGRPLIERFQTFLGFGWQDVLLFERRLLSHAGITIFLLRALPIVPLSLISAAAGVLRIPWAHFAAWTFAGSIPRCVILAYLGYLTRDSYEGLAGKLNSVESFVSAITVAGIFGVIFWLRARMRK